MNVKEMTFKELSALIIKIESKEAIFNKDVMLVLKEIDRRITIFKNAYEPFIKAYELLK
jgi:hypothetical protein